MANQNIGPKSLELFTESFRLNGYAVIDQFLSPQDVQTMRLEAERLIREDSTKEHKRQIFGNTHNAKSDYFVTSGDKIRYFFEKQAFDSTTGQLVVPVEKSLAKIGHALHCLNPVFSRVTCSEKVKQVFRAVGFGKPTVVQSMLIFKNPKVGGEYTPHQDASFLCSEPINLAGIWMALDDAIPENGCLEFIPGSHHWPLARRYVRVSEDQRAEAGDSLLEWTAPVMEYDESKFIKVPVKKGALVLIHGLVVHRSAANNSDKARWIYTFHAYDRSKAKYLEDNWLQVIENDTFVEIY